MVKYPPDPQLSWSHLQNMKRILNPEPKTSRISEFLKTLFRRLERAK